MIEAEAWSHALTCLAPGYEGEVGEFQTLAFHLTRLSALPAETALVYCPYPKPHLHPFYEGANAVMHFVRTRIDLNSRLVPESPRRKPVACLLPASSFQFPIPIIGTQKMIRQEESQERRHRKTGLISFALFPRGCRTCRQRMLVVRPVRLLTGLARTRYCIQPRGRLPQSTRART